MQNTIYKKAWTYNFAEETYYVIYDYIKLTIDETTSQRG